jgi:hypothetical protein
MSDLDHRSRPQSSLTQFHAQPSGNARSKDAIVLISDILGENAAGVIRRHMDTASVPHGLGSYSLYISLSRKRADTITWLNREKTNTITWLSSRAPTPVLNSQQASRQHLPYELLLEWFNKLGGSRPHPSNFSFHSGGYGLCGRSSGGSSCRRVGIEGRRSTATSSRSTPSLLPSRQVGIDPA